MVRLHFIFHEKNVEFTHRWNRSNISKMCIKLVEIKMVHLYTYEFLRWRYLDEMTPKYMVTSPLKSIRYEKMEYFCPHFSWKVIVLDSGNKYVNLRHFDVPLKSYSSPLRLSMHVSNYPIPLKWKEEELNLKLTHRV